MIELGFMVVVVLWLMFAISRIPRILEYISEIFKK